MLDGCIQSVKESEESCQSALTTDTELGYKVDPMLRKLEPCGQREPGGGIYATKGPPYSPSL